MRSVVGARVPAGGRGLPALVATVLAWPACASETSSLEVLARSVQEFNAQVRWGRTGRAAAFLVPALRQRYESLAEKLEGDVRIFQVDVLRAKLEGKSKARVRVRFVWQRAGDVTVSRTVVLEVWKRVGKAWLLASSRTVSGPRIPLLDLSPRREGSPGKAEAGR